MVPAVRELNSVLEQVVAADSTPLEAMEIMVPAERRTCQEALEVPQAVPHSALVVSEVAVAPTETQRAAVAAVDTPAAAQVVTTTQDTVGEVLPSSAQKDSWWTWRLGSTKAMALLC